LQVLDDAEPTISGAIEDATSNLLGFLNEPGDEFMSQRIGQEVRISRRPAGNRVIDVTRGESYPFPGGWRVTGGRYLMRDIGAGGRIVGAINYTLRSKPSGRPLVVVSNIVVAPDSRRTKIATRLLEELLEDHPGARVDSSMTLDGAAFFGYTTALEPAPTRHASRAKVRFP
jgi:ribosomal protein S18 acetylase RimI-like enzyme